MRIHAKLLILLLAMAMTPLIVISAFHQISIRMGRRRLISRIHSTLDANAKQVLQEILDNCDEILQRESRLVEALIRRQAREVELRLSEQPETPVPTLAGTTYGLDESLRELSRTENGPFGGVSSARISYRRQALFLPDGVDIGAVNCDMERLEDMTGVYYEIRRNGPSGILWQYTSLENGLHLSYPWSDAETSLHPPGYDPRQRDWYLRAKTRGDAIRTGPLVDAVTGRTVVTVATPVRWPDSSFAGVTAMDRLVPDILAGMRLPFRWAEGAKRMFVVTDPQADPCELKITVLLQGSYVDAHRDWQRPIELEQLRSEDAYELKGMAAEMQIGVPGIRTLEYEGRRCLWAYGKPTMGGVIPLLIVPCNRVTDMADSASRLLLGESRFLLGVTGTVLLLVVAATAALAAISAKAVTRPIDSLMSAGRRLAHGDYEARVDIGTGDELERLGEVFNETGPKLKEREKMKQSLELAGAIQRSLLPKDAPSLKHFDIAAQCLYCDETGGDYYDFIDMIDVGQGKTGVVLGDVSGHGIGAALLMTAVRSSLRTNIRHHGTDLTTLFHHVNRDLVRDTGEDKFVTLFCGILDDEDCSLTWASGGHDSAIWRHAETGAIEELANTGMLMGIFEEALFEQTGPLELGRGDVVVIGTDGIWEARDASGSFFGKERLYEILHETHGTAREICDTIVAAVSAFCGSGPREDDITVVVLRTL